jgi:hypothetical protein
MLVPKWRSSGTIQWRKGPWDASANITYQSDIRTGATATAAQYTAANSPDYIRPVMVYNNVGIGTMNYYEVGQSATQVNTAISYRFGPEAPKWIRRTAVRLGINNLLDADAPFQNVNAAGYSGGSGASLWVGRSFSLTTTKDF